MRKDDDYNGDHDDEFLIGILVGVFASWIIAYALWAVTR